MAMIASSVGIGRRPHRVTVQNPSAPVSDGGGGFTQTWSDLNPPSVFAQIVPATGDQEGVVAHTVQATATHVITCPYHPSVTTATRVVLGSRIFQVTGVVNPEERNVELILSCKERVT